MTLSEKWKDPTCHCIYYGQSDKVAVPDEKGKVTLVACGSKVAYENWMKGICIDCITAIKEFEGEMSETPYSDYMPSDAVNREWDSGY